MELLSLLRFKKPAGMHSVVRSLLEHAMEQRSLMKVEFTDRELTDRSYSGPCMEFTEDTMLVGIGLCDAIHSWTGDPVLVSFKIDSRGASSYYQFASHLRGMVPSIGGFGLLLDAPTEIVSNQKRGCVRITPRPEVVLGVGLWRLNPKKARPADPTRFGDAELSYRQDHPNQLTLTNISAGGLGLKLRHTVEDQSALDPQLGDRLLCLLMLGSQDGEQTLSLWLDCSVVSCGEKENRTSYNMGLQFDAWAMPAPDGEKNVNWFPVSETWPIASLTTWIMHQQLMQMTGYRPSDENITESQAASDAGKATGRRNLRSSSVARPDTDTIVRPRGRALGS